MHIGVICAEHVISVLPSALAAWPGWWQMVVDYRLQVRSHTTIRYSLELGEGSGSNTHQGSRQSENYSIWLRALFSSAELSFIVYHISYKLGNWITCLSVSIANFRNIKIFDQVIKPDNSWGRPSIEQVTQRRLSRWTQVDTLIKICPQEPPGNPGF